MEDADQPHAMLHMGGCFVIIFQYLWDPGFVVKFGVVKKSA